MNMVSRVSGPRVIVALDFSTSKEALAFTSRVNPKQCRVKVGFELFTSVGPEIVETLVKKGFDVFLDLKYHDIPTTVAGACAAAARLGIWMINVHALGGRHMLLAAREAIDKTTSRPLLIGVTVLTSHSAQDLGELGIQEEPNQLVVRLARLTKETGLDGVVCSAQEASTLRSEHGETFCLVTPGIRPTGSHVDDQVRILTPREAVQQGAHYLVIGRPITQSIDPASVIEQINKEVSLL